MKSYTSFHLAALAAFLGVFATMSGVRASEAPASASPATSAPAPAAASANAVTPVAPVASAGTAAPAVSVATGAPAPAPIPAIPPAPAKGDKTIDVYLIGGQSNATGQGYMKNLPEGFKIDTRVFIYNSGRPHLNSGADPNTWQLLRQASESPDRFGPELGFGNRVQALFPDRKIALIKHAHSGTNLSSQWNPGADASDRAHFGGQYATFVDTVEGGLKSLHDLGYEPVIRGMIWHQGENDANGGNPTDNYGKNLAHLITRVREQFKAPDMVFVLAYILASEKTVANYRGRDAVRQAEHDLDQNSGSPTAMKGVFTVTTSDLSTRADDPGMTANLKNDFLHVGTPGQLEMGKRMADAMKTAPTTTAKY